MSAVAAIAARWDGALRTPEKRPICEKDSETVIARHPARGIATMYHTTTRHSGDYKALADGHAMLPPNVRFGWVKSGHSSASAPCPLYPRKRTLPQRKQLSALCQKQTYAVQQFCPYSITSSARPSNESGMVKPRVLTIFRLSKPGFSNVGNSCSLAGS